MTLYVFDRETVTTGKLVSVNISETGAIAAWSSAATYAIGDDVSYVANHTTYRCILAHTANPSNPSISPTRWVKLGATSTWKAFDNRINDKVVGSSGGYLQYIFSALELPNAVALFGLKSPRVDILVKDAALVATYSVTKMLINNSEVFDYWEYFFNEPFSSSECIFANIPYQAYDNQLIVRVYDNPPVGGFAVAPEVGEIIFGKSKYIGQTLTGSGRGITDYSRKDLDIFGNITIVQRSYARRVVFNAYMSPRRTDYVEALLAKLRSTATVFYSYSESPQYGLTVFGIYKDFFVPLTTFDAAFATIEVEGLT